MFNNFKSIMCWSNNTATPVVLKKPLRVYKVGTSTTSGNFISLYQDFIYYKSRTVPTVKITPEFTKSYCPYILFLSLLVEIVLIYEKVIIHI